MIRWPHRVTIAASMWSRVRGLIGKKPLRENEAFVIPGCTQVHTFGMSVPIDVLFLGADHCIVGIVSALRPWRISPSFKDAVTCIELRAGTIDAIHIQLGDVWNVEADSSRCG